MQDESGEKKVVLTIEHPGLKGGVQTYRTEDGWELIVMLGKKGDEHYQLHRLIASGPNLLGELIESSTRDFPDVVIPAVTKVMMQQFKESVEQTAVNESDKKLGVNNNSDKIPPGTIFN